jgi:hypothetical protein
MREFTKSMVSFSWAMSLFGMQQMGNMLRRPDPNRPRSPATEAFDAVTCATEGQLGDVLKETFKAGDKLQRAMVDMMLGSWMSRGMNPQGMMQAATDAMQQATGCCGQGMAGGTGQDSAGWGPMPDTDPPAAPPAGAGAY